MKHLSPGNTLFILFLLLGPGLCPARAQGTAFTYQGRLADGGQPANGSYHLAFSLYGTGTGGTMLAGPVTNPAVTVTNGLFTVMIDFGAGVFTGGTNWLDIAVGTNDAAGFTELTPRQLLTPVPYAILANTASNLLGTVTAAQVSGILPAASLPATVITNNEAGVNLGGSFTGNGAGLTNIPAGAVAGLLASNAATAALAVTQALALADGRFAAAVTGTNVLGLPGVMYWQMCCFAELYSPSPYEANYLLYSTNGAADFGFVQPQPVYVDPTQMTNALGPTARSPSVFQQGNTLFQIATRQYYTGPGTAQFQLATSSDQIHWAPYANVGLFPTLTNAVLNNASPVLTSSNTLYSDTNAYAYLAVTCITNFNHDGIQDWNNEGLYIVPVLDATFTNCGAPVLIVTAVTNFGPLLTSVFADRGLFYAYNGSGTYGMPCTGNPEILISTNLLAGFTVKCAWTNTPMADAAITFQRTNLWWAMADPGNIFCSTNRGTNWTQVRCAEAGSLMGQNLDGAFGVYFLNAPLTNQTATLGLPNLSVTGEAALGSVSSSEGYFGNVTANTLTVGNGLSGDYGLPLMVSGSLYVGDTTPQLSPGGFYWGSDNLSAGIEIQNAGTANIALGYGIVFGQPSSACLAMNDGTYGYYTNNYGTGVGYICLGGGLTVTGAVMNVMGLASSATVTAPDFVGAIGVTNIVGLGRLALSNRITQAEIADLPARWPVPEGSFINAQNGSLGIDADGKPALRLTTAGATKYVLTVPNYATNVTLTCLLTGPTVTFTNNFSTNWKLAGATAGSSGGNVCFTNTLTANVTTTAVYSNLAFGDVGSTNAEKWLTWVINQPTNTDSAVTACHFILTINGWGSVLTNQ